MRDELNDFIFKQLHNFVESAYTVSELEREALDTRRAHQTNLALAIRENMQEFEPSEQEMRFAIATVAMCYLAAIADASICEHSKTIADEEEKIRHKVEHMAACIQDYVMALAQFPEVEVSV